MQISKPRLKRTKAGIKLEADISTVAGLDVPNAVYFEIPKKFKEMINDSYEPFIIGMLPLAMHLQEDIVIEGALSDEFRRALTRYQKKFAQFFPGEYTVISIHSKKKKAKSNKDRPTEVLSAFSGGVDSLYTLLQSPEITHAVLVHGFDIRVEDDKNFRRVLKAFESSFAKLPAELVSLQTNIREFYPCLDWNKAHGPALLSAMYTLSSNAKKAYIPSSHTNTPQGLFPWGTHPHLDTLMSTKTLRIIHHGTESDRVKKLNVISKNPLTYDRLRVCWENIQGVNNCGVCDKCVRTMAMLETLGVRGNFSTFPKSLSRNQIRNLKFDAKNRRLFARQMAFAAWNNRRFDMLWDLSIAAIKTRLKSMMP